MPQGALSNYKKAPDEPDDHAIGRSRGGLTTKIHALTDQREAPVAVRLTAGQAGDNPQLVPLLDDYAAACTHHDASGRDFGLLADKAYSHPSTRSELRSRRIKHTIPQRSDQIEHDGDLRLNKKAYKKRSVVECCVGWLKECRRLVTRFDKLAVNFLAFVQLAVIERYLRLLGPSDTA